MAQPIEALIATDVRGGGLSGDSGHALLIFEGVRATFSVALPPEKLNRLVSLCTKLIHQAHSEFGGLEQVSAIPIDKSAVNKADDGRIALRLEQEGGGALIFGLRPAGATQLLRSLAIALDIAKT